MNDYFLVEVPMLGRWYRLNRKSQVHYRIVTENSGDVYDVAEGKLVKETDKGRTAEQIQMLIFLHGGIEQFPNFEMLLGINGGPLPNPYTFGTLDVTMQQLTETDTPT